MRLTQDRAVYSKARILLMYRKVWILTLLDLKNFLGFTNYLFNDFNVTFKERVD